MDGPRAPTEQELPNIYDFLNRMLRPQAGWSIVDEYPTALAASNRHNIRVITQNNQVLSHAVLKPLIVRTPHLVLKVGAIGSVITDEPHRGQGLSRRIIQSCLEEAARQDCDIAVLWTNLYDFYRPLGFELAGYEESFQIEKKLAVPPAELTFKRGAKISPEAILRLYQKHTVQTHRTVEEIRRFLQIPQSEVHTAWSPSGLLEAFAVEGKGADLTDYVHEWSGSIPALCHLFNSIFETKGRPFVVICPRHSTQLIKTLSLQGLLHHEGFLGMIRVVKREQLLSKVGRALASLQCDPVDFSGVDDQQLVRRLFGPWEEPQGQSTGSTGDVLPLRFWLWGWDSV